MEGAAPAPSEPPESPWRRTTAGWEKLDLQSDVDAPLAPLPHPAAWAAGQVLAATFFLVLCEPRRSTRALRPQRGQPSSQGQDRETSDPAK